LELPLKNRLEVKNYNPISLIQGNYFLKPPVFRAPKILFSLGVLREGRNSRPQATVFQDKKRISKPNNFRRQFTPEYG
jgi:hypothetical protein